MQSITLGMVNQRPAYGIAASTTLDKFRLLRLLVDLPSEAAIAGSAPEWYTSVCLNVDFASKLHTDSHNDGDSWIVTIGEHTGGDFSSRRMSMTSAKKNVQ